MRCFGLLAVLGFALAACDSPAPGDFPAKHADPALAVRTGGVEAAGGNSNHFIAPPAQNHLMH